MDIDLNLFLDAVYSTLFHSIWQGVLLSVVGGSIMIFGGGLRASTKYLLLTGSMLLFVGVVISTFLRQLNQAPDQGIFEITGTSLSEDFNISSLFTPLIDKAYMFYDYYLAHYDRVLVSFWLLIICFKSIRMLFDLYGIHRLRSTGVSPVKGEAQRILANVLHKLDLKKNIGFFESALARTPMVIGAIKPLILFPIGLLTSMTPQQVEAILAHEIAHILRRDFLVNVLQSGIELIFFFNPPVLWVSSLIRKEREICCDEIAIALIGNKNLYVSTLINCQEHHVPAYGMAFIGNRKPLLKRVKRLLGIQSSPLGVFEKAFVGLSLLGTIFIAGAFTANSSNENNNPVNIFNSFIDPQVSQDPDRVNGEGIVNFLMDEKIVTDPKNFSFKVTNFALYIDGVRQEEKIHQNILKGFVKNNRKRLNYTQTVRTDM